MAIKVDLFEVELNDANYTWTNDPFGPDWEIIHYFYEFKPMYLNYQSLSKFYLW